VPVRDRQRASGESLADLYDSRHRETWPRVCTTRLATVRVHVYDQGLGRDRSATGVVWGLRAGQGACFPSRPTPGLRPSRSPSCPIVRLPAEIGYRPLAAIVIVCHRRRWAGTVFAHLISASPRGLRRLTPDRKRFGQGEWDSRPRSSPNPRSRARTHARSPGSARYRTWPPRNSRATVTRCASRSACSCRRCALT
jgi:hypothetical protein